MNVLSLFDGMSCGRIALERCGHKVDRYFASEIDKYAMKVAKANYPDIEHLGDVRSVETDNLPDIDLLIGGSPCQGFSFAGRHLNFQDQRSRLFFEYVRILEETQPRYFLLENVRMSKESERVISEFLDCEPITINSNLVSAQNRHRLYWTNIPFDGLPDDRGIKLSGIIESGNVDRDKAHCIDANYWKGGNLKSYFEKNRRQLVFGESVEDYRKLTPIECERLQTVPDNYTAHVSNTQRYKMLGNGWTVDVVAHILKNMES
jgi:site-specific DNA-cytosine methylase